MLPLGNKSACGSTISSSPSCSRTLGKTLAHIQSMIAEEDGEGIPDVQNGESSNLFQPPNFTARLDLNDENGYFQCIQTKSS